MLILNDLFKLHEKLKNSFVFHLLYNDLVNGKEKNHWERIITSIEKIITAYNVQNFADLKQNYINFVKELNFAQGKKIFGLISSDYTLNLQQWRSELKKKTKMPEIFEIKENTYINDFSLLVAELTEQYQHYQGKANDFMENLEKKRERVKEITLLKKQTPAEMNLPIEILMLICSYINNPKDLCHLESASYFFLNFVTEHNFWSNALIKHKPLVEYINYVPAEKGENAKKVYKDSFFHLKKMEKYDRKFAEDSDPKSNSFFPSSTS